MRVTLEQVHLELGSRTVLDQLSVELIGPAVVGIMGPSGSGKTSLLNLVAGHLRPTGGTVSVLWPTETSAHVPAWIVQNSLLLYRRTTTDNVALGAVSRGRPASVAEREARAILARLGLIDVADARAYTLSGGEMQRVTVARAIAAGSALILADEPTASLDAVSRRTVCDALASAASAGALVLVATHDPYVASRCDTILLIEQGRLVQDASHA